MYTQHSTDTKGAISTMFGVCYFAAFIAMLHIECQLSRDLYVYVVYMTQGLKARGGINHAEIDTE